MISSLQPNPGVLLPLARRARGGYPPAGIRFGQKDFTGDALENLVVTTAPCSPTFSIALKQAGARLPDDVIAILKADGYRLAGTEMLEAAGYPHHRSRPAVCLQRHKMILMAEKAYSGKNEGEIVETIPGLEKRGLSLHNLLTHEASHALADIITRQLGMQPALAHSQRFRSLVDADTRRASDEYKQWVKTEHFYAYNELLPEIITECLGVPTMLAGFYRHDRQQEITLRETYPLTYPFIENLLKAFGLAAPGIAEPGRLSLLA